MTVNSEINLAVSAVSYPSALHSELKSGTEVAR